MPRFRPPLAMLPLALAVCLLPACDVDDDRLTLRDVDRYTPALLIEALEPSWNNGRIRHDVLTGHYREALELFAELLNEHGPSSRPSLFRFPRQRVSFYANAHNGLALLSWLRAGSARSKGDLSWDPAWSEAKHAIDGEQLSLDDLAHRVRLDGGREATLLLSRGRRDTPRFPAVPYDATTFDADRGAQIRFVLNEEGLFSSTSGNVVGPHWLGELINPAPPDAPSETPEPLGASDLNFFFSEHLAFDHPLRLEILRALRENTLVLQGPDPTIDLGFR